MATASYDYSLYLGLSKYNIHRFPIYEHKYKEVPQGVSVGL